MASTDPYIIGALQVCLVLFSLYAVFIDQVVKRFGNSGVSAEVERGEKSMAALYTVYGAATASLLVLVDATQGLDGHKVLLITVNFSCLTYLFFFSSWFRNRVFFKVRGKIRKD